MALSPYPIDTAPNSVATSALQNIPFPNLIGGPLNAAVQAQAQAAKTTADFIDQVCMNKDANGNKSAVTVVFSYQDGYGLMRTLTVPLITILPIPYIAVTDIDINFTANISASSATSTSSDESSDVSAGGSGSAKIGWGIFSADVQFNASYSSKKSSKATQDSKYSVEYTMGVSVKAGSADMPGGLSRVLNILADGITMKTRQSSGALTALNAPTTSGTTETTLTFTLLGPNGLGLDSTTVTNLAAVATSTPTDAFTVTTQPVESNNTPGVYTLGLTPKAGLQAGTYAVQLTLSWKDTTGAPQTFNGTVNVTMTP